MEQFITFMQKNLVALGGPHKSLSQTRAASDLAGFAREQLAVTCRGMWLKTPDYEVLFKEAEEEKGLPSTSLF